jgi:hypothetical protein
LEFKLKVGRPQDRPGDHLQTLILTEKSLFALVVWNGNNYLIRKLASPKDDIEAPAGQGVETARVGSDPHLSEV